MPEEPKTVEQRSLRGPLSMIAIFAGAILLGFGFCAVDSSYFPRQPAQQFGPNGFVGDIGAWMIVLSAIGLGLSLLALIVLAATNALDRKKAGR